MTITTAKLAGAVALAWLAPHALAQLPDMSAPKAFEKQRAGWRFTPTVELRETWTDNVGLDADDKKKSQLVSEATPGFLLDYLGPRIKLHSRYEQHWYAMRDRKDSGANRSSRRANAELEARLVDDFLFFDASGNIGQHSVSPFGQRVYDNGYAAINQAEVTSWSLSPYLKHRFGNFARGELRYTRDAVSSERKGFANSDADTVVAQLQSGPLFHRVGWSASYLNQQLKDSAGRESEIENLSTRLSWRVSPTLALSAGAGYDQYDYQSLGGKTGGGSWLTGVHWTPSRRTSVSAELGRRFYGPSKKLAMLHRSRHTIWSVNYSDSINNTRNEFLLPATLDTAALLERLFLPNFSDAAERQRAVADYIRDAGLPPTLANDVSFFSNRFYLQRQLRASSALRLARTSAVFSVHHVRRDAVSVRETDSVLLGSSISSANDSVTQQGANLTLSYRYSPRTSFNLTHDRSRAQSRSAALRTHTNYTGLGARYSGPKGLGAALQLRHVSGTVPGALGAATYTENALSASVFMQF